MKFFFKQWGGVQKKKAGRELDGRTYDDTPPRFVTDYIPSREICAELAEDALIVNRFDRDWITTIDISTQENHTVTKKLPPMLELINGNVPKSEAPPTRKPPNRTVDVCIVCNKEDEIVSQSMCRNCYQADYRQRTEMKVRHGESSAQRKQKRDRLRLIHSMVINFDKAEELGLLETLSDEAQSLIKLLVRELVEQQQKIVGKSDAAILEEALAGVVAPKQEPN